MRELSSSESSKNDFVNSIILSSEKIIPTESFIHLKKDFSLIMEYSADLLKTIYSLENQDERDTLIALKTHIQNRVETIHQEINSIYKT